MPPKVVAEPFARHHLDCCQKHLPQVAACHHEHPGHLYCCQLQSSFHVWKVDPSEICLQPDGQKEKKRYNILRQKYVCVLYSMCVQFQQMENI